jgi:hypothetical protein
MMLRFRDEKELREVLERTGATIVGEPPKKRMVLRPAEKGRNGSVRATPRRSDEHDAQVELVACCRELARVRGAKERGLAPLALLHAIPNGGKRGKVTAAKMKAEGQLAGVPDLFLPAARRGYHGMYIEMKAGYNRPTPSQKEMMDALAESGYYCVVCYSHSVALAHILWYLGAALSADEREILGEYGVTGIAFDRAGRALYPRQAAR